MINLDDFNHITQESPITYEDLTGITAALREAQQSSHTTQVGASVVGVGAWNKDAGVSKRYLGTYTDGMEDYISTPQRHHAESLAITMCARIKDRCTQDATMYAPWASCLDCAMAIQAAGIQRVVVLNTLMQKTPERWLTSVEQGLSLLYDHNIRVDVVDVNEGYFGFDIRMDGKVVKV